MGAFYGFSVDGDRKWKSNNADLQKGRIDWLGNSMFLLTNNDGVYLFDVDGKDVSFVKTIENFPSGATNIDGLGIAINHSRHEESTLGHFNHGFDGHQCYITRQILTEGGEIGYDIVLYDYEQSQAVRSIVSLGTSVPSGLVWDGHFLWVRIQDFDGTALWQYDVGNNVGRRVKTYVLSGGIIDMAFDGQFMWALGGVNVRVFEPDRWSAPYKAWAHGLTDELGMTFDGQQLILSAN